MTLTLLTKLDRHDNRTPPPLATEELHRVASQLGLDVNELQQSMKGGFGSVFIAEDHGLSRRVAIKILYKDWKPERMRREIVALRTFCSNESLHSHLIAIYSCFETEHYFCYTMECADNCAPAGAEYKPDSLSNRITQHDKLPSTDEIAVFFHQLLDAVEFLHSQKLVHLDIKPDNILFVKGKLKLADYSLITSMDDVIEKSCGTSGFVPPNQRRGANGGLDGMDQDLYALGVVLHCYAENSLTWDGVSSFPRELQSQPFYKKLNRFLLKACNACEPERFHNVSELRQGFDACFPQKRQWSKMLMVGIPVVLLIAVLALQVMFVINRRQTEKEIELNQATVVQQEAMVSSGKTELKSEDVKTAVNLEDNRVIASKTIETPVKIDLKLEKVAVTLDERLALARKELDELTKTVDSDDVSAELLEDKRFGQDVEWMTASFDKLKVSLKKVQIRELEKQMEVYQRAKNLDVSKFSEEATSEFQKRFKEYTVKRYWGGNYQKDTDFSLWVINKLKQGQVNPNVEVVDSSYKEYSGPLLSCIFSGRIELADEIARELLKLGANSDVSFSEPLRLLTSDAWFMVLNEGGIDRMEGYLQLVLGVPDFYRLCWPQRDLHLEDLTARLICLKHNLMKRDNQGNTPLHIVARIGSARLVALMLLDGADVNAVNDKGETPLHLVLKYGHLQLEPLLLKSGANSAQKTVKGESVEDCRKTGLFFQNIAKKDYQAVRKALENGMSPNLSRGDNITILQNACRENDVELVKLLLEFNADIELAGTTYPLNLKPIVWAFRMKSLEVFELLLEKGADSDINAWGDHRESYYLLPQLCERDRYILKKDMEKGLRWLRALMNARKPPRLFMNNREPVIRLAFTCRRDEAFVSLLLDKYESFPTGSDVIATALFYEYPDSIVERLVEKKADVNAIFTVPANSVLRKDQTTVKQLSTGQKTTALWLAVGQERPKIVELLIKKGANVNWKDENGKTVRDLPSPTKIRQMLMSAMANTMDGSTTEKRVTGVGATVKKLYAVVDLSGGANASIYPVHYTDMSPDLNDDTCRTTQLWLRKIPAGTFMMGAPTDEVGRKYNETQHKVTLTQDYYIGIFECTQKQWELVMGSNPVRYLKGDSRPVSCVNYDMIRGTEEQAGAGWPVYGHTVDSTSFMGKLQRKTGLVFDLPTEAQWEYACRAGTTTALNSGKNLTSAEKDVNMDDVGRYKFNASDGKGGYSEDTKVGSYLPNAWGLYDMHGNVSEWCLDWGKDRERMMVSKTVELDPVGPKTGFNRALRGGNYVREAWFCRSAQRSYGIPASNNFPYHGFRIAIQPPQK